MVYLLSRSPFSSPPLLADRVGVAVGVAGFISLLLASVLPPRPKSRQKSKTDNVSFATIKHIADMSCVGSRFDRGPAEKTGAAASLVKSALKSGLCCLVGGVIPRRPGIPGIRWRVKVGTEHTWIVRRCRVSHCLSVCLHACLSVASQRGTVEPQRRARAI